MREGVLSLLKYVSEHQKPKNVSGIWSLIGLNRLKPKTRFDVTRDFGFAPSPTIKTLLRPLMGILDAFRPAHKYLQYIVRGSGVSPTRTHILHTECDKSFINIVDVLASAESFSLHNLPTINKSCRLSVFLVPRHPFSPPMHPLVAVCIST